MTDEIEIPLPPEEEREKLELRMVVLALELPKIMWWTLDCAEKGSGVPASEGLAYMLQKYLFEEYHKVKNIMEAIIK